MQLELTKLVVREDLPDLRELLPGEDVLPVRLVESPLVREWREPGVLDNGPQLGQFVVNQKNLKLS